MITQTLSKTMPLSAIWMEAKVMTDSGLKTRIEKGMKVVVENEALQPGGMVTHNVLECFGNIYSTVLYFKLQNITTGEITYLDVSPITL